MLRFRAIPLALVLGVLGALTLPAQPMAGPRPLRKLAKRQLQRNQDAGPAAILERLQRLDPGERERFFENIPEARRAGVRRRFDAYNRLAPEERERLGENLAAFLNMPPQRQELARAVFRRFAAQPDERRSAMHAEVRVLTDLSPEDRRSRVNADEFRNRFSGDEKLLMFDMIRIFPGRRAAARPAESIQQ